MAAARLLGRPDRSSMGRWSGVIRVQQSCARIPVSVSTPCRTAAKDASTRGQGANVARGGVGGRPENRLCR